MYIITYLLPSQLLPYILDKLIDKLDHSIFNGRFKNRKINKIVKERIHIIEEVFVSVNVLLLLLIVEGIFIYHIIEL